VATEHTYLPCVVITMGGGWSDSGSPYQMGKIKRPNISGQDNLLVSCLSTYVEHASPAVKGHLGLVGGTVKNSCGDLAKGARTLCVRSEVCFAVSRDFLFLFYPVEQYFKKIASNVLSELLKLPLNRINLKHLSACYRSPCILHSVARIRRLATSRLPLRIPNIAAQRRASNRLIIRNHDIEVQHAHSVEPIRALLTHIGIASPLIAGAANIAKYTFVALALPNSVAILISPLTSPTSSSAPQHGNSIGGDLPRVRRSVTCQKRLAAAKVMRILETAPETPLCLLDVAETAFDAGLDCIVPAFGVGGAGLI
jgi:hypothetical protein